MSETEREVAEALKRLTRNVRELCEEIRGASIAAPKTLRHPSLPTEPERRLRSLIDDETK